MSMMIEGFKIGAEFVFDAGLASAEVGKIQEKFGMLSSTIDDLVFSAQRFGLGLVASFTGLGGGIISVLGSAISASDQFNKAQLAFSNIIASNMDKFTGNIETFSDRMLTSKGIIKDIIADARRFGIPAKDLLQTTEIVGALTAPAGLTGQNFDISRQLSANFLKASGFMGINPSLAMNQFVNVATGQATEQGMLGQRLFKEIGIQDTQGNILRTAKEWNKFFESDKLAAIMSLNKAMDAFTKNADELAGQTNTINALIQRTKDLFFGFASILRPLGDVILPVIVKGVNQLIGLVHTQGKGVVENIAKFLQPMADAPMKFLERLLSLRHLASDVADAAWYTAAALSLAHLTTAINLIGSTAIGIKMGAFIAGIPILGKFVSLLGVAAAKMSSFIGLGGGILAVFGKLSIVFGGFLILFQAFSRAMVKLQINDAISALFSIEKMSDSLTRIGGALIDIFRPIDIIIEGLSEVIVSIVQFFSPVLSLIGVLDHLGGKTLRYTSLIQIFTNVIEFVAHEVRNLTGAVMGLFSGLNEALRPLLQTVAGIIDQGPIDYFTQLFSGAQENPFKGYGFDSIMAETIKGYSKFSAPYLPSKEKEGARAVANNITNIGKVDINNNIKQEVQPDRIAFTVKEQLMKLAENKRSSAGRRGTLRGALVQ